MAALGFSVFLPSLRARRRAAGAFSRGFFRAAGIPLQRPGDRAAADVRPASSSPITPATSTGSWRWRRCRPNLPSSSRKRWCGYRSRACCCGVSARHSSTAFDRHKGGSDARRVWKLAAAGQSLVFFPEGTFDSTPRIGKFLGGAFATAERSKMPVVAVAIHGTRDVLPTGTLRMRRKLIRFEVLGVLDPHGARHRSRELIAQAVGEPLAP